MVTACTPGSQGPISGSHTPFAAGLAHRAPGRRPACPMDGAPYPAHTPPAPRRPDLPLTRCRLTLCAYTHPSPRPRPPDSQLTRPSAPGRAPRSHDPGRRHALPGRTPPAQAHAQLAAHTPPAHRRPGLPLIRCRLTLDAHTHPSGRSPPVRVAAHTPPSPQCAGPGLRALTTPDAGTRSQAARPPRRRTPGSPLTRPRPPACPTCRSHAPLSPPPAARLTAHTPQCAGPRSALSRPGRWHSLPGRMPPPHPRAGARPARRSHAPRPWPARLTLHAHTHPSGRSLPVRVAAHTPPSPQCAGPGLRALTTPDAGTRSQAARPPRRRTPGSPLTRPPPPRLPDLPLTRTPLPAPCRPAHCSHAPAHAQLAAHTPPAHGRPGSRSTLTSTPPAAPSRPGSPLTRRPRPSAPGRAPGSHNPRRRHALPGRTPPAQAHARLAAHTPPAPRRPRSPLTQR
ncbi:nascent polypeptide-associated complex subunit alpha, muscle-specific form-like [Odocoileus virginianus]|uniref:Nascent polypeptide-associated complex subunit alpha, muscle-specific form-like n=1 Tax=Odocoileus virginianus TaxID=9874 RepID=A0ABM4HZ71_ODOVR